MDDDSPCLFFFYFYKQGWGAAAGFFLAPWSQSRLRKKKGAVAAKNMQLLYRLLEN